MWNKSCIQWAGFVLWLGTAGFLSGQAPSEVMSRLGYTTRNAVRFTLQDRSQRQILAAGVLGTWLAFRVEDRFQEYAQSQGLMPEWMANAGDVYGGYWAQWFLLGGLLLDNRHQLRDRTTHLKLEAAGMAFAANGVVTWAIKLGVNRTRPNGGHHSFPSGHTSNAFAIAAVADETWGHGIGAVAYGMAGVVGLSRIHDNKHYLSDVVAGATLGTLIGRAFVRSYQPYFQVGWNPGNRSLRLTFPL
ncbi:MAG: phosphatase PAP2 family protein [Candidatus Neomarinimicrobiota bacterium]|nr:MAG: phosphatase PAP2 family protein [Candidatus Neomarinimicrobiota bacterium]